MHLTVTTFLSVDGVHQGPAEAFLLGRRTCVASSTLSDPSWGDTTVLDGKVAAAVRETSRRGPAGEEVVAA